MDLSENKNLGDSIKSIQKEIEFFEFNSSQAELLQRFSEQIAIFGGPQNALAREKSAEAYDILKMTLTPQQENILDTYANGQLSALVFKNMISITEEVPNSLPDIKVLENNHNILMLASRNQILLKLVAHRTFAYDIDNDGQIVRLVGNFKGGGAQKIETETQKVELSSHSGLPLGPHTEAPYWCALKQKDGHSPAPSALILTTLWNPMNEPTSVIPLAPIYEKLGQTHMENLMKPHFNFTRSDSFVAGKGEDGCGVSIIEHDEDVGLVSRYNSYRFSVQEEAPEEVKSTFTAFQHAVDHSEPFKFALSPSSAMVINNVRALHCRDIVQDNRRLLVRLFGYSKFAEPVILREQPMLVQG